MKKFINSVDDVEKEMLQGILKAYPDKLKAVGCEGVLVRPKKDENKVAVLSGGGSGHEPAFGGYVGKGMLDAAVCGAIYTAPAADCVYSAIKEVATGNGVLMIPNNYTGDIMNFEMAAEMARMEGIRVDMLCTNDDVAIDDVSARRGVAGAVFVLKVAGAMAESGASLDDVKDIAKRAIDNVRTMGVAINPSTIPAAGKPGFVLGEDEMEVGIGAHGEPGVRKEKLKPADEITDMLLERILSDMDYSGSEVAVMVNGSGGTPLMELYLINNHVHDVLESKGIRIYKTFVGNYMTSIEQEGFSVSLFRLDEQMKKLLDAPADTPALRV